MKIYKNEREYCPICKKLIFDFSHDCFEDKLEEKENYSDRLAYGFKLLDMED